MDQAFKGSLTEKYRLEGTSIFLTWIDGPVLFSRKMWRISRMKMTEDVCLERNAIFLEIISRETGHLERNKSNQTCLQKDASYLERNEACLERNKSSQTCLEVSREETKHVYRETRCHREMTTYSTSKGLYTLLCRLSTFSAGLKLVRLFLVRNKLFSINRTWPVLFVNSIHETREDSSVLKDTGSHIKSSSILLR